MPEDFSFYKGALEAVLMVAENPIPLAQLAASLDISEAETQQLLSELARSYAEGSPYPRGFQLRESGGGWRFYSHPRYGEIVGKYITAGKVNKLSIPALETLAVIAYRQPVTRAQIAAIRGVNVDSVLRTLLARDLIEQAGATADTGAGLYITTAYFLEKMGMNSLAELPDLAPYLPDEENLEEVEKEIL